MKTLTLILILIALPCLALEHPLSIGGHTLVLTSSVNQTKCLSIKEKTWYFSDLLAWYPMLNGNNPTVDESNNNNNGTVNGATYKGLHKGYSFDGVNDYISISKNVAELFVNKSAISFVGWVKRSRISTRETIMNMTIVNSGAAKVQWEFSASDTITVGARAKVSDSYQSETTVATITDTDWHFIVGVIDIANDDIKIYVDGAEESTTGSPSWSQAYFDSDAGNFQAFGKAQAGLLFSGNIDDPRIYKRALTDSEILKIYNGTKGVH